jgi:hypothetical protein
MLIILHLQATRSSETLASYWITAQYHDSEDRNLKAVVSDKRMYNLIVYDMPVNIPTANQSYVSHKCVFVFCF